MSANLSPFDTASPRQRFIRGIAGPVSVAIHVALALLIVTHPEATTKASEWVEMAVQETKPPPPPPPPPPPEPPKPKAKPKEVAFKDIPKTPPQPTPEAAPPPTATPQAGPPRRVQGLHMESFATGSGTGLSVNAGNTLSVAAGKDKASLGEAGGEYGARYTEVLVQPHLLSHPDLVVTDEARKAHVQGKVTVTLDLDDTGKPVRVRVVKGLGYGLDEACVEAWQKSRWRPGKNDGVAIPVSGIPQTCVVYEVE